MRPILLLLLAATGLHLSATSQTPTLVQDINATSLDRGSSPSPSRIGLSNRRVRDFLQVGPHWYFTATTALGNELWKTDGSPSGTVLVKDIQPGSGSSAPSSLTAFGTKLVFVADDGTHGRELWISDGTSRGTVLIRDIRAGSASSAPSSLCFVAGRILFAAEDGVHGRELWATDGAANTALILDLLPGATGSDPRDAIPLHAGKCLFTATTPTNGRELYMSNGSSSGTALVKDIHAGSPSSNPTNFAIVGREAYFGAADASSGRELWKSDGSASGTIRVRDIRPGAVGSDPDLQDAEVFAGSLYFRANDGIHGNELWKTDGSLGGTMMVKDIRAGVGSSNPSWFTPMGSTALYFVAGDSATGTELWKTDGTASGTQLLSDVFAGASSSSPSDLAVFQGRLLFSARRFGAGQNGRELYTSDGSSAGTRLVADLWPGAGSSNPAFLTLMHNKVVFRASNGTTANQELFEYSASSTGIRIFKDLTPMQPTRNSSITDAVDLNGITLFAADDGIHGSELWRSDGTASGTFLVKDIYVGGNSSPRDMTAYRGEVYFAAFDNANGKGRELWKTDGTSAGTVLVADIEPGSRSSSPWNFCVYRDKLYFSAIAASFGRELYVTDGTAAGTKLVHDLAPGSSSSSPSELTVHNGKLYFSASTPSTSRELFVTDGSSSGTQLVIDLHPGLRSSLPSSLESWKGRLWFSASSNNNGSGREIYTSDGTAQGTRMFLDLNRGAASSGATFLTGTEDQLYFRATASNGAGSELWKTDGTVQNTVMVADLEPGTGGSIPNAPSSRGKFVRLGRGIFFSASTRTSGREAYFSDGTSAGTVSLGDLYPGSKSSSPSAAVLSNGRVLFAAANEAVGSELWIWAPSRASATRFGESCGPNFPTLDSTAPVLGGSARISGVANASRGIGILYLGSPPTQARVLGCADYVGIGSAVHLASVVADGSGQYAHTLSIPMDASLSGIRAKLQSWFLTLPTILPVETTNGVQLVVGQ